MIKFLERVGQVARLIVETVYYIFRGDVELKITVKQMVELG